MRNRCRVHRRVFHRVVGMAGAAVVLVGAIGLGGAAAESPPVQSYRVSAYGDAIQVQLLDSGAPVFPGGEVVAGSPATAGAYVDSIGQSSGYAGGPYPGATIISLPGTYNAVRDPRSPEAPGYPFYVHSNSPGEPEAQVTYGPSTLKSMSGPNESVAQAHSGAATGTPALAAASAVSASRFDPSTDTLSAVTDVAVDGFTLAPDVHIGHIAGHAKLRAAAGENPAKESNFEVGSFTVAGEKIGLTDKGFVVGDRPAATPDPSPVNTVTSPAGITLTYLPAVETPTSTQSAGFSATFKRSVPNHGDVTVKLTFGRVAVQVESLTAPAPGSVDGGGPETSVDVPAPLPSGPGNSEPGSAGGWNGGLSVNSSSAMPTTPPLGIVPPGSPSSANSDPVQEPASGTRSGSGTASAAGGSDQAALAWRQEAASLAAGYHTDAGHGLYVALIIGGLAVLVGGLIFGPRAVRTPATHVLRVPPL